MELAGHSLQLSIGERSLVIVRIESDGVETTTDGRRGGSYETEGLPDAGVGFDGVHAAVLTQGNNEVVHDGRAGARGASIDGHIGRDSGGRDGRGGAAQELSTLDVIALGVVGGEAE